MRGPARPDVEPEKVAFGRVVFGFDTYAPGPGFRLSGPGVRNSGPADRPVFVLSERPGSSPCAFMLGLGLRPARIAQAVGVGAGLAPLCSLAFRRAPLALR